MAELVGTSLAKTQAAMPTNRRKKEQPKDNERRKDSQNERKINLKTFRFARS